MPCLDGAGLQDFLTTGLDRGSDCLADWFLLSFAVRDRRGLRVMPLVGFLTFRAIVFLDFLAVVWTRLLFALATELEHAGWGRFLHLRRVSVTVTVGYRIISMSL